MLTLTALAKEKITARLQGIKTDPGVTARLIPSPVDPGKWKMILDNPRAKDHVVESEDGMKILLIGAELVTALEEMTMDFRETPEGTGFAIYKPSSAP